MSTGIERRDREQRTNVTLRFGGSITGVGIGAGLLYLIGADHSVLAFALPLVVGIVLLIIGSLLRHPSPGS